MSQNNEILVNMKVRKILWEIKFVKLLFVIDCSSGLQDGMCVQRGLKAVFESAQSNMFRLEKSETIVTYRAPTQDSHQTAHMRSLM